MSFSSLSQSARARILLELKGAAKYVADANKAQLATQRLALATDEQAVASKRATRATFLHAQALYTLRRYAFFGTLALVGIGAAALKMGFDFDMAFQTTVVSMSKFVGGMQNARKEANYLYLLAARTPFEFGDVSLAARRILPLFNGNLHQTNQLIETIGNSLAAFGVTTPAALQRATLALTHMLNIGHVTGQTLFQLSRDNIPMQKALQKAFHATGAEIKDAVSRGAISAQDAITALNRYVASTPGFINAAQRLGLRTVQGNITTFRDFISKAFGSAEMGGFSKLADHLRTINTILIDQAKAGTPLTITRLAAAIDAGLTPSTHRIMFAFITFKTALQDVWNSLNFGMTVLNAILWPITKITSSFGGASSAAKNMGHVIALLIDLLIIEKSVMFLAALAIDAYKIATWLADAATKAWKLSIKLLAWWQNLENMTLVRGSWVAQKNTEATYVNMTAQARLGRVLKTQLIPWITGTIASFVAWVVAAYTTGGAVGVLTAAVEALTAAIFAIPLVGWALLAITAIGLLYWKWKPFRDVVNETLGQLKVLYDLWLKVTSVGSGPTRHDNFWGKAIKKGARDTITSYFPFLSFMQHGGVMNQSGLAVVGEAGPELLHLPRGAQVTPMQSPQPVLAGVGGGVGGGDNQPIVVQLVLRDRVVEQVMVDIQEKRRARR